MLTKRNKLATRLATARDLRHHLTPAEAALWTALRSRTLAHLKFRRQHPLGPYILDFCCPTAFLIIELDGPIDEQTIKVVAPRGRLSRQIGAWNDETRTAFGRRCLARSRELIAGAPERLGGWMPPADIAPESARVAYIAARIAEEIGGSEAYLDERRRQSEWLAEQLTLD